MKKFFMKVVRFLCSPFVWIWRSGPIAGLNWLRINLSGRDTLKEELRKAGWGLTGIGVTGSLVNGKALGYLVALGITLWLIGLFENLDDEGSNNVQSDKHQ